MNFPRNPTYQNKFTIFKNHRNALILYYYRNGTRPACRSGRDLLKWRTNERRAKRTSPILAGKKLNGRRARQPFGMNRNGLSEARNRRAIRATRRGGSGQAPARAHMGENHIYTQISAALRLSHIRKAAYFFVTVLQS